jgi:Domain of unknown function (DUF5668)
MNEQSAQLVRSITGPIMLITVGVLLAFDRFTDFRFTQTWPVLLIVIGFLKLVGGGTRRRFMGYYQQPQNPGAPTPPPPSYNDPGARQ